MTNARCIADLLKAAVRPLQTTTVNILLTTHQMMIRITAEGSD